MEENLLYSIAGLLHDIGKFGQRADTSIDSSTTLTSQSKSLANQICNVAQQGYYTHQHVIWTNNFLESHKAIFNKANLIGLGENNMFNLAVYHHKPSTFKQAIITMADHWSSGIDRNTDKEYQQNTEMGRDKFRSVPLVSLFNELATSLRPNGNDTNESFGYQLQKSGITSSIFPTPTKELNLKKDYQLLWFEFNEEVKKISTTDAKSLIYSLYHLLKKYTWYIPASTVDYPDCSLFEHSKTTAAFSHCLAAYFNENDTSFKYGNNKRIAVEKGERPVLMICGDISGIQSFIYNISNKSAIKSLKGRSFYVQLLSETICDELLDACNATIVNQIYVAGGKFYALLPNTKPVKDAIKIYQDKLQQKIWDEYKGAITVNIGMIAFGMEKGSNNQLLVSTEDKTDLITVGELWKLLADKTSIQKKVKYNNVIRNNFSQLFSPQGTGGNVKVCAVTAEELNENEVINLDRDLIEQGYGENQLPVVISKAVNNQIKIGEQLYDAKYLIQSRGNFHTQFEVGVSTKWGFVEDNEHRHSVVKWKNIQFDDFPILFPLNRTIENTTGVGFAYYGGIPMATKGRRIATLEELCELHKNSMDVTIEKLGVLRMDIDNLGQLFMNGFNKNGASFSKLATLSASLEQYFSGYLNTIKNNDKYKHHINIVYSGGDDLFALGRWDLLIDFAIEVRSNFKKFVTNRTDITLSGGLAIVGAKFPIAKAAELSGDAEKAAKDYSFQNFEKNAITLFGIPVNWDLEMPFVIACKNDLVQWIADKQISKGLLMKMFDYYTLYKSDQIEWQWQAAYTIARFAKDAKLKEQQQIYNWIKNLLFIQTYKSEFNCVRFDAFIVACRWAELIIKQQNN